jgi:hypothetical protein
MSINKFARGAIAAVAAITLALTATTAANAAVWWPTASDNLTKTTFAVDSQETFGASQGYSSLFNGKDQLCDTLGEIPCGNITTDVFNGSYVLPVCATADQILCLDNVNIYTGTTPAKATLIRAVNAPTAAVNAAATAAGIPAGGTTTLWTGADGKTYAVSVEVQLQIVKGKLTANTFAAVVNPYTQTTGAYSAVKISRSGTKNVIDDQRELNCTWVEAGLCGELQDFAAGVRVGLAFRLGKPTAQFLNGRLATPTLSVGKAAGKNQILVNIDAAPVSVQQLSVNVSVDKTPAGLYFGGTPRAKALYSLDGTKNANALRAIASNKASGLRTYWSVNNQDEARVTQSTKCKAASGIAGLVATDALALDAFKTVKSGTSLKQTITGMLTNPDGKADSGSLDIVLASDFARCVFGLGKTGTLKVKATGGMLAKKVSSAWVSASLTGIKYGAASTPTVTVTK